MKPVTIGSWDDATAILGQIRDLDLKKNKAVVAADLRIQKIKNGLKSGTDGLADQREILRAALEEFCRGRLPELAPAKCRDLIYGRVGFRDEPYFAFPKKNETLLEKLRAAGLGRFIIEEPKPNKKGIEAEYKDLDLIRIGVARKVRFDKFYIDFKDDKK